jgi:hypothetical protein
MKNKLSLVSVLGYLIFSALAVFQSAQAFCPVFEDFTVEKDSEVGGIPVIAGTYPIQNFTEPATGPKKAAVRMLKKATLSKTFVINGMSLPAGTKLNLTNSQVANGASFTYTRYLDSAIFAEDFRWWDLAIKRGGNLSFQPLDSSGVEQSVQGMLAEDRNILNYPIKAGTFFSLLFNGAPENCPNHSSAFKEVLMATLSTDAVVHGVNLPTDTALSLNDGKRPGQVYHLFGNRDGLFWSFRLAKNADVFGYPIDSKREVVMYAETNTPEALCLSRPFEIQGIPLLHESPKPSDSNFTVYFHPNPQGDLEAGYLSRDFTFVVGGQAIRAAAESAVRLFPQRRPRQIKLADSITIQDVPCLRDNYAQFSPQGKLLYCQTANGIYKADQNQPLEWYQFFPNR